MTVTEAIFWVPRNADASFSHLATPCILCRPALPILIKVKGKCSKWSFFSVVLLFLNWFFFSYWPYLRWWTMVEVPRPSWEHLAYVRPLHITLILITISQKTASSAPSTPRTTNPTRCRTNSMAYVRRREVCCGFGCFALGVGGWMPFGLLLGGWISCPLSLAPLVRPLSSSVVHCSSLSRLFKLDPTPRFCCLHPSCMPLFICFVFCGFILFLFFFWWFCVCWVCEWCSLVIALSGLVGKWLLSLLFMRG